MDRQDLTSVVVTYNSAEVVTDLLDDLLDMRPDSPVVVIDNASMDQTAQIIAGGYPQARLVRNDVNIGYARAVNQAFDLCTTPYVFLLNPDIRLPSPECIPTLVDWMDANPGCAACGPVQYMVGNNGYHLNFIISYWSRKAFYGYFYFKIYKKWPALEPIRVPMLNAGCILLRRSAFLEVGKINPRYFLYGEDPDLGLKFTRYGYGSWLLPNAYVIHYREKSLQTVSFLQRSRIRWHALLNISHAFITGWAGIIMDKPGLRRRNSG